MNTIAFIKIFFLSEVEKIDFCWRVVLTSVDIRSKSNNVPTAKSEINSERKKNNTKLLPFVSTHTQLNQQISVVL